MHTNRADRVPGVTIRECARADEVGVVALWRACGLVVPVNDPAQDFARKLGFQPGLFLVAEEEGALVGAVMGGYEGHRGWIYYLGVAPDRRGRGIGRSLVAEVESLLRAFGCPKINLMVRHTNPGVIAFYEKLGFATDDVLCMGKRLVDDRRPCAVQPASPRPDVTIRPYREDDVGSLYEAAIESRALVFPWLPWCHASYTIEESRAWIRRCAVTWSDRTEYNFAIMGAAGRYLGGCGLNQMGGAHHTANLGYWVRSAEVGHGVATAAVRLLVAFAFRETYLERLEIVAAAGNLASRRVAEKAGAIAEGTGHSRLCLHGQIHDAAVFAFVRAVHGRKL